MASATLDFAWCVAAQSNALVRELSAELRLPQLVARALINRGVRDPEAAARYLSPSSAHLEDPFAFRDMKRAVERILKAVRCGEKILIQGDYDVDGSASAALLVRMFRLLDTEVEVSVPSRVEDGYGLNAKTMTDAAGRGVTLLITCDNGTTANNEIALGNSLGIDTIVTDHHTVGETLPDAYALINPHVEGETVAFRDLCGAGVAFKLAWAVLQHSSPGGERLSQPFKEFLSTAQSLVAMASIADVVPLTGENRVLTKFGLNLMPGSPNPGVRALIELSGVSGAPRGVDVGFKLAPRLNAGGRMGRESLAIELLTAKGLGEAMTIAREMDDLNRKRQQRDRELTRLAEEVLDADESYGDDDVIVIGSDEFDIGVVGIVAARIMRKLSKPVVLVATKNGVGRGSGRSLPGFHLYNALNECSHIMSRFGGHELAAGLEIERDRVTELRREVNRVAGRHVMNADYRSPTLDIDAEVPLEQIDRESVSILESMEPFGAGNPEPVFAARDIELAADPKVVGRGNGHLSMLVRQNGSVIKAIGFGMGPRAAELTRGSKVRLAFTPRISTYRGNSEVELELKDMIVLSS